MPGNQAGFDGYHSYATPYLKHELELLYSSPVLSHGILLQANKTESPVDPETDEQTITVALGCPSDQKYTRECLIYHQKEMPVNLPFGSYIVARGRPEPAKGRELKYVLLIENYEKQDLSYPEFDPPKRIQNHQDALNEISSLCFYEDLSTAVLTTLAGSAPNGNQIGGVSVLFANDTTSYWHKNHALEKLHEGIRELWTPNITWNTTNSAFPKTILSCKSAHEFSGFSPQIRQMYSRRSGIGKLKSISSDISLGDVKRLSESSLDATLGFLNLSDGSDVALKFEYRDKPRVTKSQEFRYYIRYIRDQMRPQFTVESTEQLKNANDYLQSRYAYAQVLGDKQFNIGRLAEAYARIELKNEVGTKHILAAREFVYQSLKQVYPELAKLIVPQLEKVKDDEERRHILFFMNHRGKTEDELVILAEEELHMPNGKAQKMFQEMINKGRIYTPDGIHYHPQI